MYYNMTRLRTNGLRQFAYVATVHLVSVGNSYQKVQNATKEISTNQKVQNSGHHYKNTFKWRQPVNTLVFAGYIKIKQRLKIQKS